MKFQLIIKQEYLKFAKTHIIILGSLLNMKSLELTKSLNHVELIIVIPNIRLIQDCIIYTISLQTNMQGSVQIYCNFIW